MSDAAPDSPENSAPPPARPPEGPVLVKPARNPVLLDDADNSILSHLGLPFYYRHTPAKSMQRGMLYVVFGALLVQGAINLLFMPFPRDSVFTLIRTTLFDGRPFVTVEDGLRSLFNQMIVLATTLSCLCAPLLATFSLSNERSNGTMEFLRLAPLSMQSIVLGKMFAPAYVLHIISGVLLICGAAAGLACGIPLTSVTLVAAAIVLSAMTCHALGAYFACMPSVRGSAAVLGLLVSMLFFTLLPLSTWDVRGLSFLAYVSPWGAMDGALWQAAHGMGRYSNNPAEFFGYTGAVKFYMFAFHGLATTLLVWAASRKLDTPERPALPWRAWFGLWAFLLITALGARYNIGETLLPGNANVTPRDLSWAVAAMIMGFAGFCICCLIVSDHPHHRDTVLADECEAFARREVRNDGRFFRLRHALFSTGMVLLTALVIILFLNFSKALDADEWSLTITLTVFAVVAAFIISLITEVAFIGFSAFIAQTFIGIGLAVAFVLVIVVPMVMIGGSYDTFQRGVFYAQMAHQSANLKQGPKANRNNQYIDIVKQPEYAIYLKDANTPEDLRALQARYQNKPLQFYLDYHPGRFAAFVLIFCGAVIGLIFWRRYVYASLREEARRAVLGDQPRETEPAPVLPEPVSVA